MHLEVLNILLISWTDTVESKLFVVRQLQTDIQVQLILLQDSWDGLIDAIRDFHPTVFSLVQSK